MYELIQITEKSYYIESPAKIGLVRLSGDEVCLIDSGNDKDAAKKVRHILEKNQWTLRAIYNTHSNADHIGGNRYLQAQYGCAVYAKGIECAFTRYPILEPSFLFGAYPPENLRHKFILAPESDAAPLTQDVLPDGLEMFAQPGHFFDMVGFRTDDDVVYLADCLSSAQTLEKYQIGFIYDVGAYLETLETVKNMQARMFVPAHAAATQDIVPLAQLNIDKVHEIAQRIVTICEKPLCFERILQRLFNDFGLKMTFEQYALVGSTVRSYLAWLKDSGAVGVEFEDGMMLWRRV